jgi:hypothetical protein
VELVLETAELRTSIHAQRDIYIHMRVYVCVLSTIYIYIIEFSDGFSNFVLLFDDLDISRWRPYNITASSPKCLFNFWALLLNMMLVTSRQNATAAAEAQSLSWRNICNRFVIANSVVHV